MIYSSVSRFNTIKFVLIILQQVVAIFTLKSSSTNALSETAASVTASFGGWWGGSGSASSSASSSTTTTSSSVEVSINIRAFGMGLNLNGSDSFVARNMDDYFSAMKFAFKSMQNDEVGALSYKQWHSISIVDSEV